jgi:hypothetical protein
MTTFTTPDLIGVGVDFLTGVEEVQMIEDEIAWVKS